MKAVPSLATHVRQDAWAGHLQEAFHTLGIPPGPLADNVVASIAMYCRQFHPQGLRSMDLNLLIARSFCAIGDRAVAERVLQSMDPHRRHRTRWLEILSELHHFPELLPYFSLGIIRPADWAGARLDRMWTLDFGRLVLRESEKHEMMLYKTIRVILAQMHVFWDATAGEGVLGLKGLAGLNVDANRSASQPLTTGSELLGYIDDLLRLQQQARAWKTVPTLINLDL